MHGVATPRKVIHNNANLHNWLSGIDNKVLQTQLQMLWMGYDITREQVGIARQQLISLARKHPTIKHWCQIPGIGIIRASTIFAYLDTPWRFKKKSRLRKYCGVGLERTTSGTDNKGRNKPARLRLPNAVNRRLKDAVLGAATSAIGHGDNVFKDYYRRMLSSGIMPANARHAVARKMVSVMSGMWKTDSAYDPKLL
jgi:transposase